jgi:hypothetical protein
VGGGSETKLANTKGRPGPALPKGTETATVVTAFGRRRGEALLGLDSGQSTPRKHEELTWILDSPLREQQQQKA